MHRQVLILHVGIILAAALSTGCWTVAAGVTGGALLAVGDYMIQDSAEDSVPMSLAETQVIARDVLAELHVVIIDEKPSPQNGRTTRWDVEGAVLGDELVEVDVSLSVISGNLTRVYARAREGFLDPDLTTAEAIVTRITRKAARKATRASALRLSRFQPGG